MITDYKINIKYLKLHTALTAQCTCHNLDMACVITATHKVKARFAHTYAHTHHTYEHTHHTYVHIHTYAHAQTYAHTHTQHTHTHTHTHTTYLTQLMKHFSCTLGVRWHCKLTDNLLR